MVSLMLEVGKRSQKRHEDEKDNALKWKNYESISWQNRLRITIDAPLDWTSGESEVGCHSQSKCRRSSWM